MNHKRVHRIYRDEELMVRTKPRKRRVAEVQVKLPSGIEVGKRWSMAA